MTSGRQPTIRELARVIPIARSDNGDVPIRSMNIAEVQAGHNRPTLLVNRLAKKKR